MRRECERLKGECGVIEMQVRRECKARCLMNFVMLGMTRIHLLKLSFDFFEKSCGN